MLRTIFNPKVLLFLVIIIGCGYLVSQFPDESVVIIGIAIILVIGIWLYQAYHDEPVRD